MESPRTATPSDAYTAQIIAMGAAVRALACETSDSRREHFVWPTDGRGFYWYAVEAVAFDDYYDLPPAIVEAEGFARTEERAHAAALRALDEDTGTRITVTLTRSAQPRHARRHGLVLRTFGSFVLAATLVSAGGGAVYLLGVAAQNASERALGVMALAGGVVTGGLAWSVLR